MSTPGTPTYDQLRIFLTVVEVGSFAAAGRKLHRATSAITYGVANLEAQLGLTLFAREGTRRPELTPSGRSVLAEARAIAHRMDGLRANIGRASLLSVVKLVIMPLIVYGLSVSLGLDPLYTIAAVICGAVPTAKTVYILAGEYHCEEVMVASTVSMTTLLSVISLVVWLYALSGVAARIVAR